MRRHSRVQSPPASMLITSGMPHAARCSPASLLVILVVAILFPASQLGGQGRPRRNIHSRPTPSISFEALADQANAARDAQNFDQAIVLYERALARRPGWTEGWWSLGTIHYDRDRYAEAAVAFQHVLRLDPQHGTARAMLGLSEFELGDETRARADIEASLTLGMAQDAQFRQVVLYHDGLLLQRAGRFQAAQTALASLCRDGVYSPELLQTLGMAALLMPDRVPPRSGNLAQVVARIGHGACLAAQKNYDEARADFAFVVSHYPHAPNVHYAYGRFLLDARSRAEAIQAFQQQIAENPGDLVARLQIGASLYKVDSAAGVPYAEQAVQYAPHNAVAHYLLGLLLLDTGRYAEAAPHLETARVAFPKDPNVCWSLASVYAHTGRPHDAAAIRADFARLKAELQKPDASADAAGADVVAAIAARSTANNGGETAAEPRN